jgi:hypothetical protein
MKAAPERALFVRTVERVLASALRKMDELGYPPARPILPARSDDEEEAEP